MSAAHGAAAGAGRRERKKREVRHRIVEAGARLILRQGYEDTTVDQIAAAARVAQKTVFNHFPSKSHVLAALADRMLEFTRELLARERAMRAPAAATIADFFGISAELGEKAQPLCAASCWRCCARRGRGARPTTCCSRCRPSKGERCRSSGIGWRS